MECFSTSYRHNHLIAQINLTCRQKCDFTFPLGRTDLVFLILESVCGVSSISLLPFLSCQMAAGPDLTSRLLQITETVLQDFTQD